MTEPSLSRAHLEATLVAIAAVRRDLAPEILECADPLHVSSAARGLLEQLAETPESRRAKGILFPYDDTIWAQTKSQHALMQRVDAITVHDLFFWPLDVLLSLVNQLPARPQREPAWERALERGLAAPSTRSVA